MEIGSATTGTRFTTALPSQVGGTQDGAAQNPAASTANGTGTPAGRQAMAGGGNLDLASVVDTLRGLLAQLTALVGARGGDLQVQPYGGRMMGAYGMSCEGGCCGTMQRASDESRVAASRGGGDAHAAHMHG